MTERPILFSPPMVRALLAGTKTQTRRIMKPQPSDYRVETVAPQALRGEKPKHERPYFDAYNHGPHWCWWDEYDRQGADWIKCPYGVPGDRLWVRENCRAWERPTDNVDGIVYSANLAFAEIGNTAEASARWLDLYHYDGKRRKAGSEIPSIHMPRWASRLTLEISEIRVQRLLDISEADAIAEGLKWVVPGKWAVDSVSVPAISDDPRQTYFQLWDAINGVGAAAANPWVWAVSFKVGYHNISEAH